MLAPESIPHETNRSTIRTNISPNEKSLDDLPEAMEQQTIEDPEPPVPESVPETADAEEEVKEEAAPEAPPAKTYDFPDKPPFTAFVGNLSYGLKEPDDLKRAVEVCAKARLGQSISILGARISFDREGKHRGFGYVEVETLDELKLLMQLNDGESTIAGRKAQLDTATGGRRGAQQNNNRRGGGDIDGSRFRGGRFSGNNRRNSNRDDGPPPQRTSLKLAPRTRKEGDSNQGSSSGIFGGAKARDEQAWEKKRLSSTSSNGKEGNGEAKSNNNNHDRRRSSQSGRGRGVGRGKGDHNGGNNNNRRGSQSRRSSNNNNNSGQPQVSPEEKAAAAKGATAAKGTEPAKKAAPVNKFALLMDSDSD